MGFNSGFKGLNRKLGGTCTRFQSFQKEKNFGPVQSLCELGYSASAIKVVSQPRNCKSPEKEGQDKRRRDKYFIS